MDKIMMFDKEHEVLVSNDTNGLVCETEMMNMIGKSTIPVFMNRKQKLEEHASLLLNDLDVEIIQSHPVEPSKIHVKVKSFEDWKESIKDIPPIGVVTIPN